MPSHVVGIETQTLAEHNPQLSQQNLMHYQSMEIMKRAAKELGLAYSVRKRRPMTALKP